MRHRIAAFTLVVACGGSRPMVIERAPERVVVSSDDPHPYDTPSYQLPPEPAFPQIDAGELLAFDAGGSPEASQTLTPKECVALRVVVTLQEQNAYIEGVCAPRGERMIATGREGPHRQIVFPDATPRVCPRTARWPALRGKTMVDESERKLRESANRWPRVTLEEWARLCPSDAGAN